MGEVAAGTTLGEMADGALAGLGAITRALMSADHSEQETFLAAIDATNKLRAYFEAIGRLSTLGEEAEGGN